MNEEIIFKAPEIVKPEFRLYYDEGGNVICYSADRAELPHKYIVIDALIFAEGRPDVKVINGKLVKKASLKFVSKYKPSTEGIKCKSEDLSVLSFDDENTTTWNYEVTEIE